MSDIDVMRRFSGVRRLYGDAGLQRLLSSHVAVVGIGGVGSWAAEALARNAIGHLTLIDLDNVAESNVNRQIHALEENFGKAKVTAMAERIQSINPACLVNIVEEFITADNCSTLIPKVDYLLDCTDDVSAKIAMIRYAHETSTPFIVSGAAGGRLDPTTAKVLDLSLVQGDKLLARVRQQLRKFHQYPAGNNVTKPRSMRVSCVYSNETVKKPEASCDTSNEGALTGLNCAGYGSSVAVTATFGFVCAQQAIQTLVSSALT